MPTERVTTGAGTPSPCAWSVIETIDRAHEIETPKVAMSVDGAAVIAYQGEGGVWSTDAEPDGPWSVPARIAETTESRPMPFVVMEPTGHVIAAWLDGDEESYSVVSSFREGRDGPWSEPAAVGARTSLGWGTPLVALATGGAALAARVLDPADFSFTPVATRFDATWGGFAAVQTIGTDASGATGPNIDAHPEGNLFVTWADDSLVWVARFDATDALWVAPEALGPVARNGGPEVVADDRGNAVVAWAEYEGAAVIRTARFDAATGQWLPSAVTRAAKSSEACSRGRVTIWRPSRSETGQTPSFGYPNVAPT